MTYLLPKSMEDVWYYTFMASWVLFDVIELARAGAFA